MAKTYRLDLFVKHDSTATEQQVYDFGLNWVNDRTNAESNKDENGDPINAYYCDVTDFKRGGKKYMIFSDLARDMLELNQKEDIIDPPALQDAITANENSIAAHATTLNDHEERITTLEESADQVDATVI